MTRCLFTDFDYMITQMVSDTRPLDCAHCEFFFSLPPPDHGVLGLCIRKNVHIDYRQMPCDWRKLVGIRMITEEAARLVPPWLFGIKRWCAGDGTSIEQLARGYLTDRIKFNSPGGDESDEKYLARDKT